MSHKTIAKFGALVILFVFSCAVVSSCSHASPSSRYAVNSAALSQDYEKPVEVGEIESTEITESSGIAMSLCQPDVLWTHNDSGNTAHIFAINMKGKHLGTWQVTNAKNEDWEDMTTYKEGGTCYLYIGDIGNNDLKRDHHRIYRVKEPLITAEGATSSKKNALQTEPADAAVFSYGNSAHDAETVMAHPQTGDVYVLTKRIDGPSLVFRIKPQFGSPEKTKAEQVAVLSLPAVPNGLLTGGAIAPDGKRVIVCDYSAAYELDLGTSANFDDIWKQKPVPVGLGDRPQGEAITFSADGSSVIATSEKKNSPVIVAKRKQK